MLDQEFGKAAVHLGDMSQNERDKVYLSIQERPKSNISSPLILRQKG